MCHSTVLRLLVCFQEKRILRQLWAWGFCCLIGYGLLSGCGLPQISAESRLFLNLTLEPVATFSLPQIHFEDATVGGFSAITYDPSRDRLYALSEAPNHSQIYTLALHLATAAAHPDQTLTVEAITPLRDASVSNPSATILEGRGLALTRHHSFFVPLAAQLDPDIPPRLSEFSQDDGSWLQDLPLPPQYGNPPSGDRSLTLGVTPQRGLKALTLSTEGDRLFVTTEAPLRQDSPPSFPQSTAVDSTLYSRLLHYWISEPESILVAEHLYPLDSPTARVKDLVALDNAGHFLSLESSPRPEGGDDAQLYQLETAVATDSSGLRTLPVPLKGVVPILKKPLLNPTDLGDAHLDLEGMTLGAQLEDGNRSLVLISNNHFDPAVPTQVKVLRIRIEPQLARQRGT